MTNCIADFEKNVEQYRLHGSGVYTILGWSLYLSVAIDALMNGRRGTGLLSWAVIHNQTSLGYSVWIVALIQIIGLIIAGVCLSNSPWRWWLRTALLESKPGLWFIDIIKTPTFDDHNFALAFLRERLYVVIRDVLIYAVSVSLIAPLVWSLMAMSSLGAFISSVVILIAAYGITKILVAILETTRIDAASAFGILIGICVPFVATAILDPTIFASNIPPGIEFTYFQYQQTFIFTASIITLLIIQIGSMNESNIIKLVIDEEQQKVWQELPNKTSGKYKPFKFKVNHEGVKIAIFSRPADDDIAPYELHSTSVKHDLTKSIWYILNLSALEKVMGEPEKPALFTFTRTITNRSFGCDIFECSITISLSIRSPEHDEKFKKCREQKRPILISVSELHHLIEEVALKPIDYIKDKLKLPFDNVIDKFFSEESKPNSEVVVQPPPPAETENQSLTGQLGQNRAKSGGGAERLHSDQVDNSRNSLMQANKSPYSIVSKIKNKAEKTRVEIDCAVTSFKSTCSNGICLNGFDINEASSSATDAFLEAIKKFQLYCEPASNLDGQAIDLELKLKETLLQKIHEIMVPIISGAYNRTTSNQESMEIFNLVVAEVSDISVHLTSKANELHQEISKIKESVNAHRDQKNKELNEITGAYKDGNMEILKGLLQSPIGIRVAAEQMQRNRSLDRTITANHTQDSQQLHWQNPDSAIEAQLQREVTAAPTAHENPHL